MQQIKTWGASKNIRYAVFVTTTIQVYAQMLFVCRLNLQHQPQSDREDTQPISQPSKHWIDGLSGWMEELMIGRLDSSSRSRSKCAYTYVYLSLMLACCLYCSIILPTSAICNSNCNHSKSSSSWRDSQRKICTYLCICVGVQTANLAAA